MRSPSVLQKPVAFGQNRIPLRRYITYTYGLLGILSAPGFIPPTVSATVLMTVVLIDFLMALDEYPPVRELAGLISTLQYIFGPMLLYTFFNDHARYRMYISPDNYFAFAVPATCMFLIALRLPMPFGTTRMKVPSENPEGLWLGVMLVFLGIASGVVVRYGPPSLAFGFYLLANLRYVGAIYVYMSGSSIRWPIIAVVVSGLALTSARQGMFHELLLWGSLGGCYFFTGRQRSWRMKAAFIATGIAAVVTIQVVKPYYRAQLQRHRTTSFLSTTTDVVRSDKFLTERSLENVTVRISQGWIVSAAMRSVPSRVQFAAGKTIEDAFVSAFIPRVISKKKKANARANVNRFTHLRVAEGTQMGLGPLGESWVNFGYFGGSICMFAFGLLLNSVFHALGSASWRNEYFFYCLPIIFLQVVKAETEFFIIFNHLTKSSIVVVASYLGLGMAGLFTTKRTANTSPRVH